MKVEPCLTIAKSIINIIPIALCKNFLEPSILLPQTNIDRFSAICQHVLQEPISLSRAWKNLWEADENTLALNMKIISSQAVPAQPCNDNKPSESMI